MRAFYYLFYTSLITCFQYTSTNVGKNLGGLAPKPLMSAAYATESCSTVHFHRFSQKKLHVFSASRLLGGVF